MITRQLLFVAFALRAASVVSGEVRCPVNAETLRYHSLDGSQIAIPVTINNSGPYEFLVDTGLQVTIVEPSLAEELGLKRAGNADVSAVGNHSKAEFATPDLIEVGPLAVRRPTVVVESLAKIQALHPKIRGLLGGNFLWHFDLLIDYAHKLLCFDESGEMRQNLRGEHITVVQQADRPLNSQLPHRLLVPVQIAGEELKVMSLDSGSAVPFLYANDLKTPAWLQKTRAGSVAGDKSQMSLAALPSEEVRIGTRVLPQVTFLVPAGNASKINGSGEDGLLPTSLFKRVFVSYAEHFVIFDPR